jgi:acetyl-CoA carboxylase biotin carboxylase subunit
MFEKILIANRGEIAVRVIRACRDLGIATVAVYSEADRNALHVHLADEAFCCGPPRAQDSYLATDALLAAARTSGADALHPGYGFLSENGDFAEACEASGVCFIGPSPDVLRAMGDKVASRRIMREAGVPVVPGSEGALCDDEAMAAAVALGFPVMVKASGGGGGRGLRLVERAEDLDKAVERARGEAAASFGDDTIYVEKAIVNPRHIEVQVLADAHGNAVQLFERECSVQRRHQKLLEEAPAWGIEPDLRARLGDAALRAAHAVDYRGAGTVEFLMDAAGEFYFLEMNTRVQVEHPITEEITRVDIVREMIRVAAGEPLSFRQEDLAIHGHAIEARVYAEDPAKNFLPSPGRLEVFRVPAGPGVRVDAGVRAGDTVTPHYDAMLAKVVAWGSTRADAIARLDRALAEFAVAGIKTSIPFHRCALRDPRFLEGRYDTGFVEGVAMEPAASDPRDLQLAAAALALTVAPDGGELHLRQKGAGSSKQPIVVTTADSGSVRVDGEVLSLAVSAAPADTLSLLLDGRQCEAAVVAKKSGRYEVRLFVGDGTRDFLFELETEGPT